MCSANELNGGHWAFVIEVRADAVTTTGRDMIERLVALNGVPVIVVDYDSVPPNDTGDRVVIKPELEKRAERLMGAFLGYLDAEHSMGVYELVVG